MFISFRQVSQRLVGYCSDETLGGLLAESLGRGQGGPLAVARRGSTRAQSGMLPKAQTCPIGAPALRVNGRGCHVLANTRWTTTTTGPLTTDGVPAWLPGQHFCGANQCRKLGQIPAPPKRSLQSPASLVDIRSLNNHSTQPTASSMLGPQAMFSPFPGQPPSIWGSPVMPIPQYPQQPQPVLSALPGMASPFLAQQLLGVLPRMPSPLPASSTTDQVHPCPTYLACTTLPSLLYSTRSFADFSREGCISAPNIRRCACCDCAAVTGRLARSYDYFSSNGSHFA